MRIIPNILNHLIINYCLYHKRGILSKLEPYDDDRHDAQGERKRKWEWWQKQECQVPRKETVTQKNGGASRAPDVLYTTTIACCL